MIIYNKTKRDFVRDVFSGDITGEIEGNLLREANVRSTESQLASYQNSLEFMRSILHGEDAIPENVGIAIEYVIPQTSKRIDFIVSGFNENKESTAIVVELKQWTMAEKTDMDGVIKAKLHGRLVETNHPSYQAWSYVSLLENYNSYVQDINLKLSPCAYLHNYSEDGEISDIRYQHYIEKAPIFYKKDREKLRSFIKQYVKYGDDGKHLYGIDKGEVRPSKHLADSIRNLLLGNQEFILIDDQKVAYEKCVQIVRNSTKTTKNTIIIDGGPGTGKSVVAINLLSAFINQKPRKSAIYITRNSAPRQVYQYKLTGSFAKKEISNLFMNSGNFIDSDPNAFNVLIVDEAHRLSEKSGMFSNMGENQIKEIIEAAQCSIFFIDDRQQVTLKDVGQKDLIESWAHKCDSRVHKLSLLSQFRCAGSDGYLSWLDNTLGIRETANYTFDNNKYFQVFDDPLVLHNKITELNMINGKSRMVAGYCWDWVSKNDSSKVDITIGNYQAKWNLSKHGQAWIVQPDSVSEVGCIHTCQGLELDYVGVIIGPDLIARDGRLLTDYTKRAKTDQSLKGIKSKILSDKKLYEEKADTIIRNTYRTLLTRGMKGCYIYCSDQETLDYFHNRIAQLVNDMNNYDNSNTGAIISD